jgi:sulfite reductase (NADPH) flavoprotein alpha-component
MMALDWGAAPVRHAAAALTVAAWGALCLRAWLGHRRQQRTLAGAPGDAVPSGSKPLLVAFASQTGFAEQLARQTASRLRTAGAAVQLLPLSQLDEAALIAAERILFIVSTCGEGDAPDTAARFARRVLSRSPTLTGLHYGVLALGDRAYQHFCGFGRGLDAWLGANGARPLFERIDVDNADATALAAWHHHLSHLVGTTDLPDWEGPAWDRWRLIERRRLNGGSSGGPVFHLALSPAAGRPEWESGDLVQVRVPADPDRPREYSVASVPSDGVLELVVRLHQRADGEPGLASSWLCEGLAVGDLLDLRLRPHMNFRLGENAHRPLLLIGNGTGIAGLRGHLRARAARGAKGAWLVFGERQSLHDALYGEEIDAWLADGTLARADRVFSRDQWQRLYVQDRLRAEAARVREWVDRGAALYVCGSLEGMAAGVHAALIEVLGSARVEALLESGRYRRDVY